VLLLLPLLLLAAPAAALEEPVSRKEVRLTFLARSTVEGRVCCGGQSGMPGVCSAGGMGAARKSVVETTAEVEG
jgi:hypothetical protein